MWNRLSTGMMRFRHPMCTRLSTSHFHSTVSLCGANALPVVEKTSPHECGVVERDLQVQWRDGRESVFHALFLRSCCQCPLCQHPTGQRLITSADVSPHTHIQHLHETDDGIEVFFENDHKSFFSYSWLRANCYSDESLLESSDSNYPPILKAKQPVPTRDYKAVMTSEKGVYNMLDDLFHDGLVIVKNVPTVNEEVKKVAERISPVSHSFLYGDCFDVISKPNPENIAYTKEMLKLHMDLAYYESPPGLQFLHCMQFDEHVIGGESTFMDTFFAADILREEDPDSFEVLCRVPGTFHKKHFDRESPAIMEFQRPHISVNNHNEVIGVFWSPPFEGPLRVPSQDVLPYYRAYKKFDDIVNDSSRMIKFRLNPTDLVIFNQRRMLHGRTKFESEAEGVRHFQGTYLNIDEVLCRYNVLRTEYGPLSSSKKSAAEQYRTLPNYRASNMNFS